MDTIGPIGGATPGEDIEWLMGHAEAEIRAIGARLAGRLQLGFLRSGLEALAGDMDAAVRDAAKWSLAHLAPDGGRGGEIIRPHGGYAGLKAYKAAEIVYDATVVFCDRFIDRRSRTHDQMVQAARSGKQNIVECSAAAGTSSKTELRLIGVARASLEELLADYGDFLRQRGLERWRKDDTRAQAIRKLAYEPNRSYRLYRSYVGEEPAEVAANTLICLVHQAAFLLDRLKKQLEQAFLEHGGISERMFQARLRHREQGREP